MTAARWLASLARHLRDAGLTVSPARLLDAAQALVVAGDEATDRAMLQVVLRLTMVTRREERAVFDDVFDAFMAAHGPPRPRKKSRPAPGVAEGLGGNAAASEPTSVMRTKKLEKRSSRNSAREIEERSKSSDLDVPPIDESAQKLLAWAVAREQQAEHSLVPPAPPAPAPLLEPGVRHTKRRPRSASKSAETPLHEMLLTDSAQRQLIETLRQLARALWLRRSRRTRRFKRGRVDMKATVARAFRTDAMVFRLMRRRRKLRRSRLLLLLDVSGSMREAARFVLAMADGMREAFQSMGVYAFVDHPIDVTHGSFSDDINWMSQSDYGNTFFKLLTEHERVLRKDVLLVVVGDARNNFGDGMTWSLAEIRARVGWLLWLNPEARSRWNTGDSIIDTYRPWCDRVLRCSNLADLRIAAETLLHLTTRWT